MKFQRHSAIIRLIENESIETQKELSDRLMRAGFDVTQATISRDIKDLRLVKVLDGEGRYRYAVASGDGRDDYSVRFRNIFRESVVHVDYAGNIVVIKTPPGVAMAAAAAIDAMHIGNMVGSIAGDDTIFLVMRT